MWYTATHVSTYIWLYIKHRRLLIRKCTHHGTSICHQTPTHWGRVTHICVSRLTITGSDNGLSPGRRQAIIWTNAGVLLIGPLGTNFSENSIEILTFSFTKMWLKVSSTKWRPFCLGLNVLRYHATQRFVFESIPLNGYHGNDSYLEIKIWAAKCVCKKNLKIISQFLLSGQHG